MIFFPSAIEQSWWQLKFLLKNTLFSQVYEKRHSSISRHYNSFSCHFFPKCHCHCQQMKGPGKKNYALPVIKACLTITVLSTYVLMLFKTGWKRGCAIPPYLELMNAANICRRCWYRCSVGKRVRQRLKGFKTGTILLEVHGWLPTLPTPPLCMPLFSDTDTCVHIRAALLPSSLDPVQCGLALVAVMGYTPSPSTERHLWFIRPPHELSW